MFSKKDKTNKSRQIEFQDFLCGTSTMDYIIQKEPYEEQIEKACAFIKEADAILVGAGAGASCGEIRENFPRNKLASRSFGRAFGI